ncbi:PAS domain-containing sensor histidine kinase [Jannaschia pagri]|uniref:histidine kinase n=1 Tax=Jannaschia pagri TaxID=2829797 RepID=A0ABQ4NR32_9RHOB|nr:MULTISPECIES: ATP-binding protein [unclassified Jannaschia]GIT93040.1 PAS domain-containing sensor histidine kinase [Jannaschia sp. AI_61]GIT96875.1 PAS domain-containing sensor histidine kinase [Jannaschia sp. AI_62]
MSTSLFSTDAMPPQAWAEVLAAVDQTYSELTGYQERLEAQNAELDSHRRLLASILASIGDVMAVLDRHGACRQASQSTADLLGVSPDTLAGRAACDLFVSEDRAAADAALEEARLTRTTVRFEGQMAGIDGAAPFDVAIFPRMTEAGRVNGFVLLARPLTELRQAYAELEDSHQALKEAQSQIVRNEKLASLGRLLAGVAHELNNPISFVYANTHALEKYLARFETYFAAVEAGAPRAELVAMRQDLKLERDLRNLRVAIDGARDGAERVRDIVDDLRRLSGDGGGAIAPFDLAEAVQVAVKWVDRGSKSGVPVTVTVDHGLTVQGNSGHVQQVVMNLVQNAMDALTDHRAPKVEVTLRRARGMALVTVQDNGPGIPEDAAARIFDPFFTTKPVGAGTGLGLSISHKIAEEHGGTLRLIPCETGTRFDLTLPLEAPR